MANASGLSLPPAALGGGGDKPVIGCKETLGTPAL